MPVGRVRLWRFSCSTASQTSSPSFSTPLGAIIFPHNGVVSPILIACAYAAVACSPPSRFQRSSRMPSIVPWGPSQDVFLVVERLGRAWRETDEDDTY